MNRLYSVLVIGLTASALSISAQEVEYYESA